MASEYVVEVEVQGFAVEGQVDTDGSRVSAAEAEAANAGKLAAVEGDNVELVDSLVREDGTGILYFRWDPAPESFVREHDQSASVEATDRPEGAAQTWHSAKLYTEHVMSSVAGAGLLRVGQRITVRGDAPASDQPE